MTSPMTTNQVNPALRRRLYYWLAIGTSYGFPIGYYAVKLGFTKTSSSIVLPIVLMGFLGVIRIGMDVPIWVRSWRPSFLKGMIKGIPVILLFIMMITFGLALKYMLDHQVSLSFAPYFETVLVLFGSSSVGSVINAMHLKYKELDLMAKGYVLGTINK